MKYNNDWLREKFDKDKDIECVFFWGHKSIDRNVIGKNCLSQWFERDFEYGNNIFPTAEHWMMSEKAKLFGDIEIFEKILRCNSPKEAKSLGRQVKKFDYEEWTKHKMRIVKNGNYLKFKQHNDLLNYLVSTKNKILVEASPYDKIWGIGMKSGDRGVENPKNWKGLNLLGYALMEVRDKLKNK